MSLLSRSEQWHRHLGVYGVCVKYDKLLVIQKGLGPYCGRYDLPGGSVETNESLIMAVQREFLEEVGIHITVEEHIGVCDYLIPYKLPKRGTSHVHHVAVFYRVQLIEGTLTQSPERFEGQDSLGVLWVSLDQITDDNSSPLVLQVMEWLKTGKLSFAFKRLDAWVVLK